MPNNHIHQLMYVSSASESLDPQELTRILSKAQLNNDGNDITGILLHSDGNLLQLIEGPQESVERLFAKIEQDTRHHDILVLYRRNVEKRDFPQFRMGFRCANPSYLAKEFPAYTDIIEQRRIPAETVEGLSLLVATFLRAFAKTTNLDHPG